MQYDMYKEQVAVWHEEVYLFHREETKQVCFLSMMLSLQSYLYAFMIVLKMTTEAIF